MPVEDTWQKVIKGSQICRFSTDVSYVLGQFGNRIKLFHRINESRLHF